MEGRFALDSPPDSASNAALLEFSAEAVAYCNGISDSPTQDYAREYARMLGNRARGVDGELPKMPVGLFAPSGKLIRGTLERMCERHFSKK